MDHFSCELLFVLLHLHGPAHTFSLLIIVNLLPNQETEKLKFCTCGLKEPKIESIQEKNTSILNTSLLCSCFLAIIHPPSLSVSCVCCVCVQYMKGVQIRGLCICEQKLEQFIGCLAASLCTYFFKTRSLTEDEAARLVASRHQRSSCLCHSQCWTLGVDGHA